MSSPVSYPPSTPIPTVGAPATAPVTVLGKNFVAPYLIDLAIIRKVMSLTDGSFDVIDSTGGIIFKVKGHALTMHNRRELLDTNGKTIVTLHRKMVSMHDRWYVYSGESTDEKDLLFMAKRSTAVQIKNKLYVYLGQNPNEDVWDFRVQGTWSDKSCVIYAGDTDHMVAQMCKKSTWGSFFVGKDHFDVTVYPNIDHAFIVSLIVILDSTNFMVAEVKKCIGTGVSIAITSADSV